MGTPGGSSSHVLYMSRQSAVIERTDGFVARNLPDQVSASGSYKELRETVASYAWAREESEAALHRGRGSRGMPRSHYRCVLSFEKDLPTASIKRMVLDWLSRALPLSSACAFVHRNTEHVHAHVWIDARGTDGKKLDFSKREWKTLGERWNRIYERELSRVERLQQRLGERANDQIRTPGAPHRASDRISEGARPEPSLTPREQAALRCAQIGDAAIREAHRLCKDLEGVGMRREEIDRSIER